MNYISSLAVILSLFVSGVFNNVQEESESSFYSLNAKTLSGEDFSFEQLKGKRVLIVNTASKCGYTPQYEELQQLYMDYEMQGFTIVGFPSNDFGKQEPGSNKEIEEFCQKNYGVTFLMMDKVVVKNNEEQHPVYQWLTQMSLNKVADAKVKWNFNKFLIDDKGHWVKHYPSKISPMDDKIVNFAKGNY